MKKIIAWILLVSFFLLPGCSTKDNFDNELEALREENALLRQEIENLNPNAETSVIQQDRSDGEMIQKTKDSLAQYLQMLGSDANGDDVEVSQEFIDGLSNVYIMGRTGTVIHGFTDNTSTIKRMYWTDNCSTTREGFLEFIPELNLFYQRTGEKKNYENYSDECYVWVDYDNSSYIVCWHTADTINLMWDYDEKMSKPIKESHKPKETPFTNSYGTRTTICAHSGCSNYIASSGDTNCCTSHSNRCLECSKYIDEDAVWCVVCVAKAAGQAAAENKHSCIECGKNAKYKYDSFTGQTEYYCAQHYEELMELEHI